MSTPRALAIRNLGQANQPDPAAQALASIQDGEQKLQIVSDWMQARPQYLTILDVDAAAFTQAYSDQSDLYPLVAAAKSTIQQGQGATLDSSDYGVIAKWTGEVGALFVLTANHPEMTPGGAGSAPASAPAEPSLPVPAPAPAPVTPAPGSPGSSISYPPRAPAPASAPAAPPAPAPRSTMILVGVGAVAAIGMVWAVLAKH
jgi:hypothetical protein